MELPIRGRGGWRPGAGRPKGNRGSHETRPEFPGRYPLHVTLRVLRSVGSLRVQRRFAKIKRAFRYGSDRFGMKLAEFSVQDDHIHLIVEAKDRHALTRGMQGLAIRIAKGVNKAIGRHGKVFGDRYHARTLGTLAEVRNAVHYVRYNFHKHHPRAAHPWLVDVCSSAAGEACWHVHDDGSATMVVALPVTWLLRHVAPPAT